MLKRSLCAAIMLLLALSLTVALAQVDRNESSDDPAPANFEIRKTEYGTQILSSDEPYIFHRKAIAFDQFSAFPAGSLSKSTLALLEDFLNSDFMNQKLLANRPDTAPDPTYLQHAAVQELLTRSDLSEAIREFTAQNEKSPAPFAEAKLQKLLSQPLLKDRLAAIAEEEET